MTYRPITNLLPQWQDSNSDNYNGAVLKGYVTGTSTPLQMATDSTGGTLVDDALYDSSGYPSSGGNVFVPHFNAPMKLSLYPTQAAADLNTGAIWTLDFPDFISNAGTAPFDSYAALLADTSLAIGWFVETGSYIDGAGKGGGSYEVVAGGTGTADGFIYGDTADGLQVKLVSDSKNAYQAGCVGDGSTNDTVRATAAIAAADVELPSTGTFKLNNVPIPSNRVVIVNGTAKQIDSALDGDSIFVNSDTAGGNTGILVKGSGTIDGNKANQAGAIYQYCIKFDNVTESHVFGNGKLTITGNYCPSSNPGGTLTAACLFEDATKSSAKNILLTDYGREGCYFSECSDSEMIGIDGYGGADSWSTATFTGTTVATAAHNRMSSIYSFEAGASGVRLDTPFSSMSDILVEDNTFQNGVNIGHSGRDASFSTATNIIVKNAGKSGTGSDTFYGINIGGSSLKVLLSNFSVDTSYSHGLNISSGADNTRVSNGIISSAGEHGINVFDATVDMANVACDNSNNDSLQVVQSAGTAKVNLVNFTSTNAGDFGITSDAATVVGSMVESVGDPLDDPNSGIIELQQTRLSADALDGGEAINGAANDTFVVTNGNVRSNSRITLEPSNQNGALAQPYIQTYADGSFTIAIAASGGAGAFVRWRIV